MTDDLVKEARSDWQRFDFDGGKAATLVRQMADRIEELEAQLMWLQSSANSVANALESFSETDFDEIVADGGITAGTVVRKKCAWHSKNLKKVLTKGE